MAQLRIVDLFAGWGGFTLGAEEAGHKVVYAANHWAVAVRAHEINHPQVTHALQDLHQANFCMLPEYDVLVASPACQGHSSASQPKRRMYHDELRATAWAVVMAAEATQPRAIIVENVPQFRKWGPGKSNDGSFYRNWKQSLELRGYDLVEIEVDARKHGVPQRRNRLFIIGVLRGAGRRPFEYQPTYEGPEPAFGPFIDWESEPGRVLRGSRYREGEWRPFRVASAGRQRRIRAGLKKFGSHFIGQDVTGHTGISLDESIRTITGQDQWWVVREKMYRPLTVRETARAMGFPDWYAWPETASRREMIVGLGNAVVPAVARDLISQVADTLEAPRALAAAAKRRPPKKKGAKKKAKKKASRKKR